MVSDQIEVAEKEPNNDVAEAQKVEIGTTVSGVISAPTDVDYTSSSWGRRGSGSSFRRRSSIDSKVVRYRPDVRLAGRKLTTNRNYRDNDALVDLVLPTDGDYLVRLFLHYLHRLVGRNTSTA